MQVIVAPAAKVEPLTGAQTRAGRRGSVTTTFVAGPLPEFTIVIVYAIVSPGLLWSFGATTALFSTPVFVAVRIGTRASGVTSVSEQVEPAVVGLQTLVAVVVAVLLTEPVVMSPATSVYVPVQVIVAPAAKVEPLTGAQTNPGKRGSVTTTFVAAALPILLTVIV